MLYHLDAVGAQRGQVAAVFTRPGDVGGLQSMLGGLQSGAAPVLRPPVKGFKETVHRPVPPLEREPAWRDGLEITGSIAYGRVQQLP